MLIIRFIVIRDGFMVWNVGISGACPASAAGLFDLSANLATVSNCDRLRRSPFGGDGVDVADKDALPEGHEIEGACGGGGHRWGVGCGVCYLPACRMRGPLWIRLENNVEASRPHIQSRPLRVGC